MQKNKDLNSKNKEHKRMKINIPPNLNTEELKSFNEIVKPQLEELYSYSYDKVKYENISIHISKEIRLNIGKVKQILNRFPKKDLAFIFDIYFVSYKCKDETENYLVNGRTLPIIYKIIIYPRGHKKLNVVLAHEIGHIVFEKCLTIKSIREYTEALSKTFPKARFNSREELDYFIKEQYANCYDNFINNPERLKEFPYIYNYFISHV